MAADQPNDADVVRNPSLTEFLLARISEDEERAGFVARQIEGNNWQPYEPWMLSWHDEYDLLCIEPSRALAECEAKRQIVEIATAGVAAIGEGRPHRSFLSGRVHDSANSLAALALPYADHPDYREEWRP